MSKKKIAPKSKTSKKSAPKAAENLSRLADIASPKPTEKAPANERPPLSDAQPEELLRHAAQQMGMSVPEFEQLIALRRYAERNAATLDEAVISDAAKRLGVSVSEIEQLIADHRKRERVDLCYLPEAKSAIEVISAKFMYVEHMLGDELREKDMVRWATEEIRALLGAAHNYVEISIMELEETREV